MEQHPQARTIVETLRENGFTAYYAGGWVRDFLLNHPSDDIDIATDAPPEKVQELFDHTVPIGAAFGIILVVMGEHQYEVATFRQDVDYQDGRRPNSVVFCSAKEDAKRRDFTINGMFFDPLTGEILDYVEGRKDLDLKIIRAIGDPHERIREDRLRMIRAIRLSCRFHFEIEQETKKAILAHAGELFPSVAIERVWQEMTKAHQFGNLCRMLEMLGEYRLLGTIFPELEGVCVRDRLKQALHYPLGTPVIAFLLALFPDADLAFGENLCKRWKLSRADQEFVKSLFEVRQALGQTLDLSEWAEIYANCSIDIILPILTPFLAHHEERRRKLAPFIRRIRENDPVVKAADLMKEGIRPGPEMGRLLKAANRLCTNEGVEDAAIAVEQLKKSPLWPCK